MMLQRNQILTIAILSPWWLGFIKLQGKHEIPKGYTLFETMIKERKALWCLLALAIKKEIFDTTNQAFFFF